MSPREKQSRNYGDKLSGEIEGSTAVYQTADGAPYVICSSSEPFVNPTSLPDASPEDINKEFNLNLGQTIVSRENKTLLWIVAFLDRIGFQWWERIFFYLWAEVVPIAWKRKLIFAGWKTYLKLHMALLAKTTGLHPSQSTEYHALTTVAWWARFFVITPRRIRFSLSQLYAVAPNEPPEAERIENIDTHALVDISEPIEQKGHCRTKGWYIHENRKSVSEVVDRRERKVIFWCYGGAYLGGDVRGNSSAADWFAKKCGMDVFIPHFRLAPEANIDDVLWDICLAYKWLSAQMDDPSHQIFVLGVSSGAAVVVRLMQLIVQHARLEDIGVPSYFDSVLEDMKVPLGGVLFGPYVDYQEEMKGSFLHYSKHDLIVTEAVQQYGLPYLEDFIPKRTDNGNPRRSHRPAFGIAKACLLFVLLSRNTKLCLT